MDEGRTFKNVKCKTGGMIPRKGDARYEGYPNIEMTIEVNPYGLQKIKKWLSAFLS